MSRLLFRVALGVIPLVLTTVVVSSRERYDQKAPFAGDRSAVPIEMGLLVDWDQPFEEEGQAITETAAAVLVDFKLIPPRRLGGAKGLYINNAGDLDRANRQIAWVFDHPIYGPFFVRQSRAEITQDQLEALLQYNDAPGGTAQFGVTIVRGSLRSVLEEGPVANSIEWLEDGVHVTVVGPAVGFTRAHAVEVANAI